MSTKNELIALLHNLYRASRRAWTEAHRLADCTDQIDPDIDALYAGIESLATQFPPVFKRNTYTREFSAICPVNEEEIFYVLVIEADHTIMVELIDTAIDHIEDVICSDYGPALMAYHEDLADSLFEAIGGMQTMTAMHHGTEIRTVRGAL